MKVKLGKLYRTLCRVYTQNFEVVLENELVVCIEIKKEINLEKLKYKVYKFVCSDGAMLFSISMPDMVLSNFIAPVE